MSYVTNNSLVEIQSDNIRGNTYRSTVERMLVFYVGGSVEVKPLGDHRVAFTSFLKKIDAIGLVKMTPFPVNISSDEITTKDGVFVKIDIVVTLKVVNDRKAIARVALAPDDQQTLITGVILQELQSAVNIREYASVMADGIANIVSTNAKNLTSLEQSFAIINLLVVKITADDRAIREHKLRIAQEKTKKMELLQQKETLEIEADIELSKRKHELMHELNHATQKADIEYMQAKRIAELAKTPAGIWGIDKESAKQIEIEKIRADVEKAKAAGNELRQYIKLIAEGAHKQGQMVVYKQLMKRDHQLTFKTLSDDESSESPETADEETPISPTSSSEKDKMSSTATEVVTSKKATDKNDNSD